MHIEVGQIGEDIKIEVRAGEKFSLSSKVAGSMFFARVNGNVSINQSNQVAQFEAKEPGKAEVLLYGESHNLIREVNIIVI